MKLFANAYLSFKANSNAKIFCCGPSDLAINILDLAANIDSKVCPEPLTLDPKTETANVYWTSGTTGKEC